MLVSKFFFRNLVNVHWKKLVVSFSFKFVLVHIKGGDPFGVPRWVAVKVGALVDGRSLLPWTYCVPTAGEFIHPLGEARWVMLNLLSGSPTNPWTSFCSKSVTVTYLPRRPI